MKQAIKNCLNKKGKNEFWSNPGYDAYKKHNGMHFNSKLAEYASQRYNLNDRVWSCKDIENAFATLGLSLPEHTTWGDVTYTANMLYAVFSRWFKIETDAVKMAHALFAYPSSYDGMMFNHFTADIMEMGECVDWEKYM